MIILDSNVWISFLNKNDNQHSKAKKIFQTINQQIILPEYIVIEVCSVLLIKAGKKITDSFVEMILNNKDVEILLSNHVFFYDIMNNFKNILNKKISFIDISLLFLSKSYQIITFDKILDKTIKAV